MKPEVKAKWLEALRSGEYGQTREKLRESAEGGYCCLGVLCDLYAKANPSKAAWDGNDFSYERETDYGPEEFTEEGELPEPVAEWAGLPWEGGSGPEVAGHNLIDWNDKKCADFQKIADLIEAAL